MIYHHRDATIADIRGIREASVSPADAMSAHAKANARALRKLDSRVWSTSEPASEPETFAQQATRLAKEIGDELVMAYERLQREQATVISSVGSASRVWSQRVREGVAQLKPPGPTVYCQSEED